jgi:3-isopropylmalate/(R)-2-methylmalate dehydratase small subunit
VVPVQIEPDAHARLVKAGGGEVTIDLETLRITLPDGTSSSFPLEPFSRHCLLEGVDELAYLIAQEADITAYERRNRDSLEAQGAEP